MAWFNFILHPTSSEEDALQELSNCKLENPSFLEDIETGTITLCAEADSSMFPLKWKHITSFEKIENVEIDWSSEWNNFSPYFQEGRALIPLSDFDPASEKKISLLPGPGFGDLSHPTTSLSLTLLSKYSEGTILIDLGCGSGILTLAALAWGARFAYSLDIDPQAIEHTLENSTLNGFQDQVYASTSLPSCLDPIPSLLVMNMTFGDQKIALKSLSFIPDLWITSGILGEQKEVYLAWAQTLGFRVETSIFKDGWAGFVLKKPA